eukprot:6186672-Pleurochrysis_carterae.AAC.1
MVHASNGRIPDRSACGRPQPPLDVERHAHRCFLSCMCTSMQTIIPQPATACVACKGTALLHVCKR